MKSSRLVFSLILISASFVLASCMEGTSGGGGGTPTATPTVPPVVTPTPQPPDEPEEFIGDPSLCTSGDTGRINFSEDSVARMTLNDGECSIAKDNRNEEYTLILYNTSYSDIGFRISSPYELEPFGKMTSEEALASERPKLVNDVVWGSYEIYRSLSDQQSPDLPVLKSGVETRLMPLAIDDEMEYKIRCDYEDSNVFCTESALLRGEGAHIQVWVDRNLPFNDGDIRHLQSTDIDKIVNVFESNIYPLQAALLGAECSSYTGYDCPVSDIDSNSKVNVIITPVLNWLSLTASDPKTAKDPAVYVDTRNLMPFNENTNAGSNEQEIIFLYAPDEEGYFNYLNPVFRDSYINKSVFAWLSVGLEKLISYNFHVFLNGGQPEEDWIDYGLGGLLADLAGFNIWTAGVWGWLDAPAYETILTSSEFGCPTGMAGPYLFMLYLLESHVDGTLEATIDDGTGGGLIDADLAILSSLMSGLTGIENIENAIDIEFTSSVETEFQALFKNWTVALATSGTNRQDLQASVDFNYYFVSSDNTDTLKDSRLFGPGIAIDTGTETASPRYGANGAAPDVDNANPVGVDLNNYNLIYDSFWPDDVVLLENAHEFTYAPGNKLYGVVKPFTANFVRMAGMFDSETEFVITSNSANLQGFIIRRSDLPVGGHARVYSESLFGPLPQEPEILDHQGPNPYFPARLDYEYYAGALGSIGEPMTIVGKIDDPEKIYVYSEKCMEGQSEREVPDFDKYQISIPATVGDEQNLAVWVERQADGINGVSDLKPMLAIVSWDDVPYPSGRYTDPSDPDAPKIGQRAEYRYLTLKSTDYGTYVSEDPVDVARQVLGECASSDAWVVGDWLSPSPLPNGTDLIGYGCFEDWVTFGNSGSWAWGMPDKLFNREILKPVPGDPYISNDITIPHYDPRSYNSLSLDCWPADDGTPAVLSGTDPDDWLSPAELRQPSLFQEQILIEMSRDALSNADPNLTPDTLAVDIDSRDTDTPCKWTEADLGNNVGGRSVVNGENSILEANYNLISEHIWRQLHASDVPAQTIYNDSGSAILTLEPGATYVILVGGVSNSTGNYELKLRKIIPSRIIPAAVKVTD